MANIRHNLTINAAAEKVYEAISTEKGLMGWWTNDASAKPQVGHINHFKFGAEYFNKMKVLKMNSPANMMWECVDGDSEWIGTLLTFDLVKKENGILLKFSHLNWAEESFFYGFCNYSWGRYLESLKLFCETGIGKPYTE